jgi:hypothetical protein
MTVYLVDLARERKSKPIEESAEQSRRIMRMWFLGFVYKGIDKDDEIDRFKLEAMEPCSKTSVLVDDMSDKAMHLHAIRFGEF